MNTEIIVIFVMLILSAFFSGLEVALLALNPLTVVQDKKNKLKNLLVRKEKLIASTLIGNNITIVASTLALERLLHDLPPWQTTLGIITQVIVFFLFAEFVPKSFFKHFYKQILSFFYIVIIFLYYLFLPLSIIFLKIPQFIFRLFPQKEKDNLTREDIFSFVNRHVSDSQIPITQGVMLLSSTRVREVMTPLPDVILLSKDSTVRQATALLDEYGYTRYPVYQDRSDNLIGYVNVFDFLSSKPSAKISTLLYKTAFVPEILSADKLLFRMQRESLPMVFAVNEYGGVSGIITLENIAEELVGDLVSVDQKAEQPYIKKEKKNKFLLDGNLDIDDFNKEFHCNIVKDGFETLTGYLIHATGKIPAQEEKLQLPQGKFYIVEANEKTIDKVYYHPKRSLE